MLKYIIPLLFICGNARAELPQTLTDTATREVVEYLDAKISDAQSDIAVLSSAYPSTSTILGIANGGTGASTIGGAQGALQVPNYTGTGATGTWAINITGSAATATDASKVAKAGDTMTGQLTMSNSSITFTGGGGSIEQVNYVQLDTTFVDGNSEGRLQWDSEHGLPSFGLSGGTVNGNVFDEMLTKVYNDSGADILNGKPVYQCGVQAHRPKICLANSLDIEKSKILGVTTEDIDDNHWGYVTTYGDVHDIDTTFGADSDMVYLSTSPGEFSTTITPTMARIVEVGSIRYSHATTGVLRVEIHRATDEIRVSSVTAGEITATTYYGSGASLTGLPGGGDATLSGNQTFTGIKTFTSSATFTNDNIFSGTTSTTTFSGWVDIGLVTISSQCVVSSINPCISTCPDGHRVLGGGCFGGGTGNAIARNYPYLDAGWYCNNETATTKISYSICARVK